ncbi:hypothetical protein QUB80_00775 [Chlorogloeopsis sp. ULAP01]|uniref:hypothetical protein n=1 Tax=Chlorogloeopsis sp. ULAP01 TaxID=3056483 RepID=UPI0025AA6627|nr:hypothetical protein [Chlorogloeopsis sp. ULAP01]MDM9379241.1 hypothetical protein [Chlorogloeopsis sp. ULAP01]
MITSHNQLLENQEIIRPVDGVNFPLVGNAIAKALAKYLGNIYEDKTWFTNCLAHGFPKMKSKKRGDSFTSNYQRDFTDFTA